MLKEEFLKKKLNDTWQMKNTGLEKQSMKNGKYHL